MREVAVGVLTRNGAVLACQRRRTARYPLKWEFPGGKLEAGESPRAALLRELTEELGVTVHGAEEFHRQEWVYPDGVQDPVRDGSFRVFYFLVKTFDGTPRNLAFEEIRWVSPAMLKELDFLEGNREAIDKLVHHPMDRTAGG